MDKAKEIAETLQNRVPPSQEEIDKALFGMSRQDFYDPQPGGIWLTKKGRPRKRIRNITSRIILPPGV